MSRKRLLYLPAIVIALGCLGLAACESPRDDEWLRITSISPNIVISTVSENTDDTVDINVLNDSSPAQGGTGTGTGITITRVHISYSYGSFNLPEYDYPVHLYLAGGDTDTLKYIPVASIQLKQWLRNNVPGATSLRFNVPAEITLRARTDEGKDLHSPGGLTITFNASGGGGGGTQETITTPGTPTGPSTLTIHESGTYTTSGAELHNAPAATHTVEYSFNWVTGRNLTGLPRLVRLIAGQLLPLER